MTETKGDQNNMTKPGTTQLSMNIDPNLKRRVKIVAINKNVSLTDLITEYITVGVEKDEKKL
jgi:predicted HicB family RNase H-like nuclease